MATLLPEGKQSFETNAGVPLVGGKVFTYDAGTNNPRVTYQDAAQTTPNTNPVILDARGEATIFWEGRYKCVLKDAADNVIWTVDGMVSSDLYASDFDAALRADLASTAVVGKGDALIGVIASTYPQAIPRTQHEKNRDTVHVNDWGGDLKKALQDVNPYTTIILAATAYNIVGLFKTTSADGVWVGNTKAGIRLQGAGMPQRAVSGRFLGGGTVIQGTRFNLADDFECYDLGVDVGSDVVDNLYAGGYHEGFCPGINITYPVPATTIKGIKVDRVSSLAKPPVFGNAATYMHSMLFENLEDCYIGSVDACGGYHTFVSKVVGLQAANITARGGELGEAVIFKSDPANRCEQNEVANLRITGWDYQAVAQPAGPLRFEALDVTPAGHTTDRIKIGTCVIRDTPSDSVVQNSAGISQNISIGHLDVNTAAVACAVRLGVGGSDMRRFTIGTFNIVTGARAFDLGPLATDIHVGSGVVTVTGNGNVPLLTVNNPSQTHGKISFQIQVAQTYAVMIQRNAGTVDMSLIEFGGAAGIPATRFLNSFPGTFVLNGANFADSGNAAFGVVGAVYQPYSVRLKGAAKVTLAGTGSTIGTVTPPPLKTMRYPVSVESGGTLTTGNIQIDAAGVTTLFGLSTLNALIHLNSVEFDALIQ